MGVGFGSKQIDIYLLADFLESKKQWVVDMVTQPVVGIKFFLTVGNSRVVDDLVKDIKEGINYVIT